VPREDPTAALWNCVLDLSSQAAIDRPSQAAHIGLSDRMRSALLATWRRTASAEEPRKGDLPVHMALEDSARLNSLLCDPRFGVLSGPYSGGPATTRFCVRPTSSPPSEAENGDLTRQPFSSSRWPAYVPVNQSCACADSPRRFAARSNDFHP